MALHRTWRREERKERGARERARPNKRVRASKQASSTEGSGGIEEGGKTDRRVLLEGRVVEHEVEEHDIIVVEGEGREE